MMPRTHWFALLAAAVTWYMHCGPPEAEPSEELGQRTPWLGPDGMSIAGRVVSPAGDPVGGLMVELVYPGDPHWEETVAFTSSTDEDGRFAFHDVCGNCFSLVVRGTEGARTYREPLPRGGDFTVVYAPMRPVPVRVHCAVPPPPWARGTIPSGWPPSVRVDWLPDRGVIAHVRLPAVDEGAELSGDSLSSILPGWATSFEIPDADAGSFGAMVPLPEGELRVTVFSACGVLSRVVRLPGDPIELRLPPEDHARISLRLSPSAREEPLPVMLSFQRRVLDLGGTQLRPYNVLGADRLSAGEYEISSGAGADWECRITLRPRTHTRVAVGPQGCQVEEEPL